MKEGRLITMAPPTILTTPPSLRSFLPHLFSHSRVAIDLEGVNLSRHGTIGILSIGISGHAWLIDTITLGPSVWDIEASSSAITQNAQIQKDQSWWEWKSWCEWIQSIAYGITAHATPNKPKQTLRTFIESQDHEKLIFDLRNDNDALYNLYGITLKGAIDLQLYEIQTRHSKNKLRLNGLRRAITNDARMSKAERKRWGAIKDTGHELFESDEISLRPMTERVINYAAQDVTMLENLYSVYIGRGLSKTQLHEIQEETNSRVEESKSMNYEHMGKHKVSSPWACEQIGE